MTLRAQEVQEPGFHGVVTGYQARVNKSEIQPFCSFFCIAGTYLFLNGFSLNYRMELSRRIAWKAASPKSRESMLSLNGEKSFTDICPAPGTASHNPSLSKYNFLSFFLFVNEPASNL